MPPLLILPTEMLQKIIDHVNPEHLVNFSACCKKVYGAAERCLGKHRERIETYSELRYSDCFSNKVDYNPVSLLREICLDGHIAFYPRSLKITRCECRPDDFDSDRLWWDPDLRVQHLDDEIVEFQEVFDEIKTPIDQKLSTTVCYNDTNNDIWRQKLTRGTREAFLCLLLLLLPNLEQIELTHFSLKDEVLGDMLDLIARESRDPDVSSNSVALTKLSSLLIKGPRPYGSGCCQMLAPFAALPSVRILTAEWIFDDRRSYAGENELTWPYGQHISNLTVLNLDSSCLNAASFSRLLGGIKGLKSFTYNVHTLVSTCGSWKDVPSIIGMLVEHTKSTLESVAFTGFGMRCLNDEHGCGSFKDFEMLKHIRMHFGLRVRLSHYVVNKELGGWYRDTECSLDGHDGIEHLVDLLPASVRSVEFDGEIDTADMSWLLKDLLQRKEKSAPHLKSIKFRKACSEPGWGDLLPARADALREKCRIMGVKLIL
ncbi:hypothetical protein IMSHALPRED_006327 [Imshaugia aleurites]|uniref:F-box domain-containing protein n=1 Tax=Imshaugia aleurites TaxID=172621 RepID=A0A8H3FHX5_9LECA|nr:hypothetical protein IMSHALPRED_006327 [Imshaugia aleurites]